MCLGWGSSRNRRACASRSFRDDREDDDRGSVLDYDRPEGSGSDLPLGSAPPRESREQGEEGSGREGRGRRRRRGRGRGRRGGGVEGREARRARTKRISSRPAKRRISISTATRNWTSTPSCGPTGDGA